MLSENGIIPIRTGNDKVVSPKSKTVIVEFKTEVKKEIFATTGCVKVSSVSNIN